MEFHFSLKLAKLIQLTFPMDLNKIVARLYFSLIGYLIDFGHLM